MEIKFRKYEGVGNDFIMIDGRELSIELNQEIIRSLCDRNFGVGADGLMLLLEDTESDFRMRYFNSDGGEANMCGNGGRCIALFAYHLGVCGNEMTFAGRDGRHNARIVSHNSANTATVELGICEMNGYEFVDNAFVLNTGVPHYVKFVNELTNVDVVSEGREIRYSDRFTSTGGVNVNFVEIKDSGIISVRTYERGVEDETLACGTGATAAAIATHINTQNNVSNFIVNTLGGQLEVNFKTEDHNNFKNIILKGSARFVFEGKINVTV